MAEQKPDARHARGYAILRLDVYGGDVNPHYAGNPRFGVYVKKLVWERSLAEAEVKRLNELNKSKGCVYFWQLARVEKR